MVAVSKLSAPIRRSRAGPVGQPRAYGGNVLVLGDPRQALQRVMALGSADASLVKRHDAPAEVHFPSSLGMQRKGMRGRACVHIRVRTWGETAGEHAVPSGSHPSAYVEEDT